MKFWRLLSVFFISVLISVSFAWSLSYKQHQSSVRSGALTFEERVSYQRAIEQVYWRNRIWPKENKTPKPALERFMPDSAIRAKVEDYLKKSNALAEYWQRPIKPEHLQAEIERMVKNTQRPQMLRELFAALGNDPQVIAECLARPALVDRLIHNWYSEDERFHGGLKLRVENELRGATAQSIRALSGRYSEIELARNKHAGTPSNQKLRNLSEKEWNESVAYLESVFASTDSSIPTGKLSPIREDSDRFYIINILEKESDHMKIATVEWSKRSFEDWWSSERNRVATNTVEVPHVYTPKPNLPSSFCPDDTWAPTSTARLPEDREFDTAVWTGNEMIIWGGLKQGNVFLSSGSRYNPSTDAWTPTSNVNSPQAVSHHTAVWTGSEMIVWGGQTGAGSLSEGGRYNPSTDTWSATDLNTAPISRFAHTAVWTGTEMIIWGGVSGFPNGELANGARYNPSADTWTPTSIINVPSGRLDHTAVWTGSEMIVWGGGTTSTLTDTGGRYNPSNNTWTATTNFNAPSARADFTGVWTGSEMIVWGGRNAIDNRITDGRRYNPSTDSWTSMTPNEPAPRAFHTAIWTGSEMIIWGGEDRLFTFSTGGRYNPANDTWATMSATNAPLARINHTAVWTGMEMIVWGGSDAPGGFGGRTLSTGGRYIPAGDSWIPTSISDVPAARVFHTAIWTGTEMIIWGGNIFSNPALSSGGRYDPSMDRWAPTSLQSAPSPRSEHSAVWTGSEMIVWGGGDPNGPVSGGGRYNPSSDSWVAVSNTNEPAPRNLQTGIWSGTEMIVWGGHDNISYLSTGGRYNPSSNTWSAISNVNVPDARTTHTAVWTSNEMIIWGGHNATQALNTGARYNPNTNTWISTSLINTAAPRGGPTAVWTGNAMIVWGGAGDTGLLADGARYNPSNDTWTGITSTSAPVARQFHTAIWTGNQMIVWGGQGDNGTFPLSGGRYNPSTDTWTPTSTFGAPDGRVLHTAVWTITDMIVWGGTNFNGNNHFDTGGRYCASAAVNGLSISDANVAEGNSGQTDLNFDVDLSASSTQDITVHFQTADDTAKGSDNDFQPLTSSITILAGQTHGVITVHVNGDTKYEIHENMVVNLTSATNGVIVDGEANGTIFNDDNPPTISISDAITMEGHSGTVPLNFNVTLSAASSFDSSVVFGTVNGTATSGSDYAGDSQQLIIPAGQTTATITISVNGDTVYEADEDLFVNLVQPVNATIADSQGIGTILNDDSVPGIFISDANMPEFNGGQVPMTFQIVLSSQSSFTTTVQYATADGTATVANNDYVSASGTVTIPPGSVSVPLTVFVLGDTNFEPHETFFVNLSNPTNATISDGQGIGTIMNDEPNGPFLTISDVLKKEGKSGTVGFSFTVTLSAPVASSVSVQYGTADGTATISGNDYVAASGFLTIPAGAKKGSINVQVRGDQVVEPHETFFVNLSNSVGAVILDPQGVGTIQNDD